MIEIAPGYLVTVATRIEGGITYERHEISEQKDGERETKRWETTRVIADAAEFKTAGLLRSKARNTIVKACTSTPFGFLLCTKDKVDALDAAIVEALDLASAFNKTAEHYKVRIITMRGTIAESADEASRAVQQEVTSLLDRLEPAMAAGNASDIRSITMQMVQVGKLLEQKCDAKGKLDEAAKAARKLARDLVKAAKAGEDVAAVVAEVNLSPIAQARFAFIEKSAESAAHEDVEQQESDALPGVSLNRFAGIAGIAGDEDEDEAPKTALPMVAIKQSAPVPGWSEADVVVGMLDEALQHFGTHEFNDKGADEVMDVAAAASTLDSLDADAVVNALVRLAGYSGEGETLAGALLMRIAESDEDGSRFDAVCAAAGPQLDSILEAAGLVAPGAPEPSEPGKTLPLVGLGVVLGGAK